MSKKERETGRKRDTGRERGREEEGDGEGERERGREEERDREGERKRETGRERGREGERDGEGERERETGRERGREKISLSFSCGESVSPHHCRSHPGSPCPCPETPPPHYAHYCRETPAPPSPPLASPLHLHVHCTLYTYTCKPQSCCYIIHVFNVLMRDERRKEERSKQGQNMYIYMFQ